MVRKLLRAWANRLRVRVISIDARPYLLRFLVAQVAGCEIYLHKFLTADGERHLHDHPWRWSFSLVLAGGYLEEVMRHVDGYTGPVVGIELRKAPCLNVTGRGFHRIASVVPDTWTLFVVGPRAKMWGFLEFDATARETVYRQPFDYDRASDPSDWSHKPLGRVVLTALEGRA